MRHNFEDHFFTAPRSLASRPAAGIPDGLACPGCGIALETASGLELGPGGPFGILSCECSDYPVIAGIPIITASLDAHAPIPVRRLCRLIRAGEFRQALIDASEPPFSRPVRGFRRTLTKKLARFFSVDDGRPTLGDERFLDGSAVDLLRTRFPGQTGVDREIRKYFLFRAAHAEHIAATGLAQTITDRDAPILDLGAGAGHMAAHLLARGIPVCGADRDFFLLLVARLAVAPGASFVCCDLEEGLPFENGHFGGLVSVNTIHFLRNKVFLASAIERVLTEEGMMLACALRHSAQRGAFRNFALSLDGYARLFKKFSPQFYTSDAVLDGYRQGRLPEGRDKPTPEALSGAPFIEMVGRKGGKLIPGKAMFEKWPHASGFLGVNPLYQPAPDPDDDGSVPKRFEFTVPSESFAAESRHLLEFMPKTARIGPEVIEAIRAGKRIRAMDTLIDSMVLIDLPAGYGPGSEPVSA